MEDFFNQQTSLLDKTFCYLIKLMGYRNQLRVNHWQTKAYPEHKMTDKLIDVLDSAIDTIAEATLGAYGRPKINTVSNNVSDIAIVSTEFVLNNINKETIDLMECLKDCNQEGILSLVADLDSNIKKFIYLNTLK